MNNFSHPKYKIKVLGVGSPFGDDQIGWKVIELLAQEKTLQPYFNKTVCLKALDRPHLQLIEEMQEAEKVYIIDAMSSDSPPGTIKHLTLEDIASKDIILSTHDMGVIQSLQIGLALNQIVCPFELIGIEIDPSALRLSAPALSAAKKVTSAIAVKYFLDYFR